jgi:hypothetical protein
MADPAAEGSSLNPGDADLGMERLIDAFAAEV